MLLPPPARWDHLDALLDAALDRPADERTAWLRAEVGHDAALYAEAAALVAAADDADDLDTGLAAWAAPLFAGDDDASDPALAEGTRLGPWRVGPEIGRGGMGTVYAATRADGAFARDVALKVVRRGTDTDEVLARFHRERRVLAGLDHPGIARLLDAGALPDGRPYLVMERADGVPLSAFADDRRLDLGARLALWAQVAEAVAYAHQRLVVHRDLKPSNVLAAAGAGGAPRVKLLDFGIARLLDDADDADLTHLAGRRFTPAYAAPEQVAGTPVTTAADVYALGVLLYELATGARPDGSRPDGPLPASRAVTSGAAAARATTAPALARRLRGDLDTILARALAPEPARRYPSAEAFLDDVRRHAAGLPVRARADTWGYRAGRFVRRHRGGVAAAVLAALLLAGGVAALAASRAAAAREQARAEAVASVLSGLFAAADPTATDGDTLTVYDALDAAAGRLRRELAGQPAVLAEVLRVVGVAYRDGTRFDRALPALADAAALARATLGPDHPDTDTTLADLATLHYMRGDLEAARTVEAERLAALRRAHGPGDPRTISPLTHLARIHLQAGHLPAARAALDAGLAVAHRAGDDRALGRLLGLEGWYFAETGDHAASVRVAREILALHLRTGASQDDLALTERILGDQLYETGQLDSALVYLGRSRARYGRVFGPGSRYDALVVGHLAQTHAAAGHWERAAPLLAEALDARTRHFGAGSAEVAQMLEAVGAHAAAQGRRAQAADLLARAHTAWASARGAGGADALRVATRREALP